MHKLLILTFALFCLANSEAETDELHCPNDWVKFNGCCYHVGKKGMTILESQEYCSKLNGGLMARRYDYNNETCSSFLYKYEDNHFNASLGNILRRGNNSCKEFPCKWWIDQSLFTYDDSDPALGPCFELVQIKESVFKVHRYVDCFEKRRPFCAKNLN